MAAAPLRLGTQLSEELSCGICLQLFTRPKVLPCQHTFCQDCLQDYAGRSARGIFQCPNCRQRVRRPPQGIAGLPDNRMAANICEKLKRSIQAPVATAPVETAQLGHMMVTIGGLGFGAGQFVDPLGVTVSDEEEIFVADNGNHRVQVFTLQGKFVRQFQTLVPGEQKMYPHDVAIDGEGNLWVVGSKNSAWFAMQYNKQGSVLRKFDLRKTGQDRGVAVDTRKNHFLITQITEDRNNLHGEVLVFRQDGKLIRTVGGKIKKFMYRWQGMKLPLYITVDGERNIFVCDSWNGSVFVYNKDGLFLFQFGGEGSGEGQLKDPHGICIDRAGNIIVADMGNSRVKMFDKRGRFIKHIATDMKEPCGVAIATQGQLVVTDRAKQTVSIFHNY